ncbi:hypothetical protein C8R48DRAFT_677063 [Suillus tomentosus]|nr:hypothetical protein C8R48DRAFT_677063 [Suillus tomentosus]
MRVPEMHHHLLGKTTQSPQPQVTSGATIFDRPPSHATPISRKKVSALEKLDGTNTPIAHLCHIIKGSHVHDAKTLRAIRRQIHSVGKASAINEKAPPFFQMLLQDRAIDSLPPSTSSSNAKIIPADVSKWHLVFWRCCAAETMCALSDLGPRPGNHCLLEGDINHYVLRTRTGIRSRNETLSCDGCCIASFKTNRLPYEKPPILHVLETNKMS